MSMALKSLAAAAVLAALAACAHTKATDMADGNRGYAVSCGGGGSWSKCLVRAGRVCRSSGYVVSYGDEVDGELVVECKGKTSSQN